MSTSSEARTKAADREVSARKRAAGIKYGMSGVLKSDFLARLAEIPPDSRTPAQRLMGDPVFERSALALRR